ncbi:hypothetical protein IG631_20094 [Alternaria alternata]|nr:hypothetical protein IG631_20094 [Alternaria alternata]
MRSTSFGSVLVLGALGLVNAYLVDPPTTAAADTVPDCSGWVVTTSSDTCSSLATDNYISEDQLKTYNWGVPPPPKPTPSSTVAPSPTNGVATPSPIQSGMTTNCNKFHLVVSGDGCYDLASTYSISLDDFYAWNPAVGSECTSLWTKTYVCVGLIGSTPTPKPTVTPAPSTTVKPSSTVKTSTGNGVATPTPVQPSMVPNCNGFYLVKAGDGCYDIAAAAKIPLDSFYQWNPYVGTDCSKLWSGYNVCIRTIGFTAPASSTFKTSTVPTTTKPASNTPTPVQQGMVTGCKKFHKVVAGDGCWDIANNNKIALDDFYKWNPAVKTDCSGLWAQYYVCIGI